MRIEDAEEFTQGIAQVACGAWRQIALGLRLGVPKTLGLTNDEWVHERLGGRVRLEIEERTKAIKELAQDGMSKRAISKCVGVDEATVRKTLKDDDAGNPALAPETDNKINGENFDDAGNPALHLQAAIIQIHQRFDQAIQADNKAHKAREQAGVMLNKLYKQVSGMGTDWWTWYEANFVRPKREAKKLMEMFSDDPN